MKLTIRKMLAFTSLILVPLLCIDDHDVLAVKSKTVKVKKNAKKVKIAKKRRCFARKAHFPGRTPSFHAKNTLKSETFQVRKLQKNSFLQKNAFSQIDS